MPLVAAESIVVRGLPTRVHVGGAGAPLLLVHGGWGGALMHWSEVWEPLATRYRVIAPDLPGLGDVEAEALGSVSEYAGWLVALLDALGVDRAHCVGNSFGASVVWSLAGRFAQRCAKLVLVDGFPMPATPPLLGRMGRTKAARRLLRWMLARWIYTPRMVPRAFADPARVPAEMRRCMREDWPRIVPRYTDILIAGDGPPAPSERPLLLFGAADRLPGTDKESARRLAEKLPGAGLRFIEHAGHFPQLERPAAFTAALERHLG